MVCMHASKIGQTVRVQRKANDRADEELTTSWCWWPMVSLQLRHMSKSWHTLQRNPAPGSISTWHLLQVVAKAGASGLCRWYSTIMLLCLARRMLSNW